MKNKVHSTVTVFFLAVILCGAFFLRAYRVDFGLPDEYHPDERILSRQVEGFLNGDVHLDRLNHPPLQKNLAFLSLNIVRFCVGIPQKQQWNYSIRATRWVSVCMGTAAVFFLYLLACYFVCRFTALCIAAVYAVMPVSVMLSKYGVPDMTVSCMMLVSLVCILRMYNKPSRTRYFFAGFFMALACAAKYNGIVVCGAFVCAHLFSTYQSEPSKHKRVFSNLIMLFILGTILGFIAGFPPVQFGGFKVLMESLEFEFRHLFVAGHKGINISTDGYFFMYHFFHTVLPAAGELLLGFILCGCVYALVCFDRKILILLAAVIPYYIAMELTYKVPVNAERYMAPLLSIFILFAGVFCDRICMFFIARVKWLGRYKKYFSLGILVLLFYTPLQKSIKIITSLYPDTRLVMKEWIARNVPVKSCIFMHWASSPLYPNLTGMGYEIVSSDGIRIGGLKHIAADTDYILVSSIIYDRYMHYPESMPGNTAFYKRLFASDRLVFEVEPEHETYLYHNPTLKLYHFRHRKRLNENE